MVRPDKDHDVIWLAPICDDERTWCQDYVWGNECDCGGGHKPVKYIRAGTRSVAEEPNSSEGVNSK